MQPKLASKFLSEEAFAGRVVAVLSSDPDLPFDVCERLRFARSRALAARKLPSNEADAMRSGFPPRAPIAIINDPRIAAETRSNHVPSVSAKRALGSP